MLKKRKLLGFGLSFSGVGQVNMSNTLLESVTHVNLPCIVLLIYHLTITEVPQSQHLY